MFGARRKKRASQQQQQEADASANMQDSRHGGSTQSGSPSNSKLQATIDPQDQAAIDMIRAKSHSRHPHSKDGDDIVMQGVDYDEDEEEEEEEDEDDGDDDLFKFMPPAENAQPATTSSSAAQGALTSSTSAPGGLLPAHLVGEHAGDPLQTATTTASTMNSDDIAAVPYMNNLHQRHIETPTSVPHTAGDSSWEHHTTPQKREKQRRPPPTAQELTEAQKVAREYQNSGPVSSKTSDPSNDQEKHTSQVASEGISGPHKRKQPYVYPGSPIYSTTPGSLQAAVNAGPRQDTPVIEVAERQRQRSSMTVSYPPEYGLHPDDTYSNEAGLKSNQYSQHYVDVGNPRQIAGTYLPQTPQTVRHRMSKTYSEHDESKASAYRLGSTWNGPETPGLQEDYSVEYGFQRSGSGGQDSKLGGMGIESPDGHLRYPTSGRYATEDGMDSTAIGSTPGIDSGKDFHQFELEDEEDSPYPEVRASVSNIDDPEMPILTFRACFLGILFCIIGGGLNFFLLVRIPAPIITPLTIQIISYPCGKFLAYILPTATFKTPRFLTYVGFPSEWSFNPGPFNIKEHAIIVLMVNVAIAPGYALSFSLVLDKFYGLPKGIAFDWLCLLTCNCIGFCLAGLCRRHLVWPASLIWPQNLVICTLFNTFHAEDDDGSDGSVTRYRFFSYVFLGAAAWYIFPGFLFTGLSAFSFMCWIAPRSKVVNQLFGVATGLGMSIITFDWSQITYIGSPLIIPWWAEVNIFVGFVLLYWIIVPILYYTNTWNFAYMPISTSINFDRWGQFYNMTKVLTPETTLDEAGYLNYSMLFMSTTYTVVYALSFTLSTAAIVHTILYNGKDIYLKFKNAHTEMEDVHAKLMRNYPEVPNWWYWAIFVVFAGIGIATIEVYETQLPVWMYLLALLVAGAYVLPGGYIYALTAQLITVNLIAETIPGYALPGKPIANILFKTISIQCLQSALLFIQDLKLGHYMKIPPRTCFAVQLLGTLMAGVSQLGVKRSVELLVPDLCSPDQKAGLTCGIAGVMYEASIIWGIIGPERFFGSSSPYHALLYFTILGALLPIPIWLLQKRYPRSWVKYINIPVLLNGATFIPPATGINYSSWFIVGFVFQFLLRRFRFRWWSKFCFITAAGLEGGTVFAAIVVFFALQFPKSGRLQPTWWGNEVYKNTGDWQGVTHMTASEEGFGPATWS